MRKIATLFFMVCISMVQLLDAQIITLSPSIENQVLVPGDTVRIVISNPDSVPITFYPLTVLDSPNHIIFRDDASFIAHIQSMGSQLAAAQELARIYKSFYFINDYLEYSSYYDPNGNARQFALIPSIVSVFHRQCGEYWRQAAIELVHAGWFSPDSLHRVSCWGHQLGHLIFENGDTALYDVDPGEPRFLDTLSNGSFMSAYDVQTHPELLDSQSSYCYPTEMGCLTLQNQSDNATEIYKDLFVDTVVLLAPEQIIPTEEIPGTWTLPPHGSVTINYKIGSYFIQNTPYLDSLSMTLQVLFQTDPLAALTIFSQEFMNGIDPQTAGDALKAGNVFFYDSIPTFKQWFSIFSYDKLTLSFHMQSTTQPFIFGQDVALPFRVHSIQATNTILCDDTALSSGYFKLYDMKDDTLVVEPQSPLLPANDILFIQHGSIPAATTMDAELYYNPMIYQFGRGVIIDAMSSGRQPVVTVTSQQLGVLTSNGAEWVAQNYQRTSCNCEHPEYYSLLMERVVQPDAYGVYLKKCGTCITKVIRTNY